MGDQSTQRKAHRFFSERMATLEAFTKQDLMDASGWSRSSVDTYWSKQFRGLIEDLGDGTYRFKEHFRSYLDWKKFHFIVTQVRTPQPVYEPTVYQTIIVYEFYLPLSHENSLRFTLDSLFFKDSIIPRLKRAVISALENLFPRNLTGFLTQMCARFSPSRSAAPWEEAADVLVPANQQLKSSVAQSTAACAGPAFGGGPARRQPVSPQGTEALALTGRRTMKPVERGLYFRQGSTAGPNPR